MDHLEIVKKLVGPIRPVGETNTDSERLENLKVLCDLVDDLTTDIIDVAHDFNHSYEASVKAASNYAGDFLRNRLGIE